MQQGTKIRVEYDCSVRGCGLPGCKHDDPGVINDPNVDIGVVFPAKSFKMYDVIRITPVRCMTDLVRGIVRHTNSPRHIYLHAYFRYHLYYKHKRMELE